MAVIIQSDPYQSLIRKIGYSVGLESLLRNVHDLTELYVRERTISYSSWVALVEGKWARKNAVEHFANFYSSLNLVRLLGKTAHPLHALDTLSILYQTLGGPSSEFDTALKFILTQCIIDADGEVFLNALASSFDADRFKSALQEMIRLKRIAVTSVFTSRPLQLRIFNIIDIKAQTQHSFGKAKLENTSRFPVRTQSLSASGIRTAPLSGPVETNAIVPDDYLRKVPQTRKGWARDLGLFEKDELSAKGVSLLQSLTDIGLKQDNRPFIFWPYRHQLQTLRIDPEKIEAVSIKPWDLLCAIAKGMDGIGTKEYTGSKSHTAVIELLSQFQSIYKDANTTLRSLRYQLPLYVAEPCLVAYACAKQQSIPPLGQILVAEYKQTTRRVNFVNIRGTEGALAFTKP